MASSTLSTVSSLASDARAWLDKLWSGIADRGEAYAAVPAASLPALERARQLARALLSGRGEASGAAVARELHDTLRELSPDDRISFLVFLAESFAPDPKVLRAAAEAYLAEPTPARAAALGEAAEPPRQELLRRMNMAPGSTHALILLREELLAHAADHPALKLLDADFHHLLASWFNRGFLELRRIDWQTPAAVLEKLIAYEAVHEIQGWEDLRRRLAPDRRCFAFFHPALPGEPLIFVEVALTTGLACAVQPLLAMDRGDTHEGRRCRAEAADTATFYSISNCQEGLRGISFGNFLIKQVVEELKAELPTLTRFATLSPVPGFRRWLEQHLVEPDGAGALRSEERETLAREAGLPADSSPAELVVKAVASEGWRDGNRSATLDRLLLRWCAFYLTRPPRSGARIDPVARFHLGNGARLERINSRANTSARGMRESYGLMVNYLYDRDTIEANHEAFVRSGRVIRSSEVEDLLSKPPFVPRT
ncbi:malonyl-CoA decarboxylase [Sabulicella glaciei]|uniref:Malonyl-CoA decarboxylase n=1 Tax=Sabulicella glaciei TaxID=2984948 RepID=A0ABT3NYX1_9PROT|nr:malonyl-CoA decarboxylase [Roseococcus sp. MDT2-1-1]MCW8087360.1 malonyl-CoA decarboxylase [Roseococcus sp. MDT2-1-1]